MKRSGFTMIELIFVIVILGILAAVAIPKLAATRDDAEKSKALSNAATCLSEVGAHYTAQGSLPANIAAHSTACGNMAWNGGSVTITANGAGDGVTVAGSGTDMDGPHTFGGTSVSY